MNPESCPKPDELRSFVRCSLSEPEADSISDHLERCPACEETVVGLERDGDTIAERIKQAAAQPTFAHEPECQQMLQSLLDSAVGSPAESPSAGADFPIAQSLRDYQIVAKLGEGGMGTVYKAVHQRLKKTVALKVLPTNRIGDQPAVARFEREMEVLGQLNHPHIVQALDAGEHDGQHYLVMEYVEGCDLSEIVKRCSRLSTADACLLISQAAEGLQYAHEHGFVHRDIKPSNLMLATGAKPNAPVMVKILDLGLARALDQRPDAAAPKADLTTTGQVMGTLDYMAPEQGGDAHQVDIRADIYSLGATLYKLLTGDSPYAEHAQKPPLQRLMAIAQLEPPAIRTRRPDIPEKLAAIVHRMLAKQPDQRFASPTDVVQALAPYCAGADLAALVVSSGATRIIEGRTATTTPLAAATAGSGAGRRLRTMLAGLAAFIALAAVIVIATRNGTVEVTAPNGELPKDVKVVVTRGGDDVEVLQVDNHWSAKIVNGEYQVELRSGQDRFEIADSKLTVSRMGRSLVTLQVRKPAKESPPASGRSVVANTNEIGKPESPKAAVAVDHGKPFVITRDGKDVRSFKSLSGAMADVESGDIVEVRSNERLLVTINENITKALSIRAGSGFRPLLAFEKPIPRYVGIQANWSLDGCDLDLRVSSFWGDDATPRSWSYRRCRIWGQLPPVAKTTLTDCVVVLRYGYGANGVTSAELDFDNCVIRHVSHLFQAESGNHSLRLRNCTYYDVDSGFPSLVKLGEKARVAIEAIGCVFHRQSQQQFLVDQGSLPRVTWTGDGNCYSGDFYGVYEQQPDKSWVTKEKGLSAWNKHWKTPENDSQEVQSLNFEWGRIQRSSSPERLQEIQKSIEKLKASQQLVDLGPNWSLVGAGDAYVRALAAEGRAVPNADLRPEQLSGGPIALLRKGQEVGGYPTLVAALEAAQDQDVLEIRKDGPLPSAGWVGKSRALTIRAAAGYLPVIEALHIAGPDRLILEGLAFRSKADLKGFGTSKDWITQDSMPVDQRATLLKVINCEILDVNLSIDGWMGADDADTAEIVNCSFPRAGIGLRSGKALRIRNSVFGDFFCGTEKMGQIPGTVEIVHSAFWAPEPAFRVHHANLYSSSATRLTAQRSIFVSPMTVTSQLHMEPAWEGRSNLYVKGSEFIGGSGLGDLAGFRAKYKTDADSIELPPWEFDPAQWRILRDKSPGYEPRQDGADYGADIDRLAKSLAL